MLRQWGSWGRKGLARTGYPTAPPWQRLIGVTDGEREDLDSEEVNKLVMRGGALERAVVVAYYVELFPKVKKKRDLPKATRIMVNASREFDEISTQRVNAIIDHIKHLVSIELIP